MLVERSQCIVLTKFLIELKKNKIVKIVTTNPKIFQRLNKKILESIWKSYSFILGPEIPPGLFLGVDLGHWSLSLKE